MTNSLLQERLFNEISTRIAKNRIATVLDSILKIGLPSIYRRLRGEVEFTFYEVVKIALELRISIDGLLNSDNMPVNQISFDLHCPDNAGDPVDCYQEYYQESTNKFNNPLDYVNSRVNQACNTIPSSLFLIYNNLTRFFLFKYIYQSNSGHAKVSFSDVVIPEEIARRNKARGQLFRERIDTSEYILDYHVFRKTVQYIEYYFNLKLISPDELLVLQKELSDLLAEIEDLSSHGHFPSGKRVSFYITELIFDHSLFYFKSDVLEYTRVELHGISYLSTQNPLLNTKQIAWIESLKKHAILITNNCEAQRLKYFNEQKSLIANLTANNMVNATNI